jgi:hypothetical protein
MIRRIFNFVLIAVMLVGAMITYDMKHKAEVAADRVARLQADIAKEKDAVSLLRAEWSVLTQPPRLESIVQNYAGYFQLVPFSPAQVGTIDDIPLRPVQASDPIGQALAGSVDTTRTGSIGKSP